MPGTPKLKLVDFFKMHAGLLSARAQEELMRAAFYLEGCGLVYQENMKEKKRSEVDILFNTASPPINLSWIDTIEEWMGQRFGPDTAEPLVSVTEETEMKKVSLPQAMLAGDGGVGGRGGRASCNMRIM